MNYKVYGANPKVERLKGALLRLAPALLYGLPGTKTLADEEIKVLLIRQK
jgi:hypothetical protein